MNQPMNDPKRICIAGRAVPVRGNDIDTDRIIPARFLKTVVFEGLGNHVFEDDRIQLKQQGVVHPMEDPKFEGAEILFVNKNFGCGSSREHAPQAIARWGQAQGRKGIRALVGESFAEIFFGNCVTLGIPCVTVDESSMQTIMQLCEAEPSRTFELDLEKLELKSNQDTLAKVTLRDDIRTQMLHGTWDSTAELLSNRQEIANVASNLPYIHVWG